MKVIKLEKFGMARDWRFKQGLALMFLIFQLFVWNSLLGQCINETKNPLSNIVAIGFSDTILVSTSSVPGEYFIVEELIEGNVYTFFSSAPGDYFSIRDAYQFDILLAHGASPFTFTVPVGGADIVSVHLNLISPPCGNSGVQRKTRMLCNSCPPVPVGIGIGEPSPSSVLDIKGEIKIGGSKFQPKEGMIRWNETTKDFEGYNGKVWLSFTQPNANVGQVPSSDLVENNLVTAIDGTGGDELGCAVSASGNFIIAGARSDDLGANANQGSAYIYKYQNGSWIHQIKLTASDGKANDNFGNAVAISGDFAIVGSYLHDNGSVQDQGAAYVYRRQGAAWFFQAKLIANDGAAGDYFGSAVSIHNDYIVVGANGDDIGSNINQGSAYIFKRTGSTWSQQFKLTAADGAASDNFGGTASIHGNTVVLGCHRKDIGANVDQGAAYIYVGENNVWFEQAKIWGTGGAPNDNFGFSVSVFQDKVLIGVPGADYAGYTNSGLAIVYKRVGSTWTLEDNLSPLESENQAQFGAGVCIKGNQLLVSAYLDDYKDLPNAGIGCLYQFQSFKWNIIGTLRNSNAESSDWLGFSVGLSDNFAVCGANLDNVGSQTDQGSISVFRKNNFN